MPYRSVSGNSVVDGFIGVVLYRSCVPNWQKRCTTE